jgi:hypothetical protein
VGIGENVRCVSLIENDSLNSIEIITRLNSVGSDGEGY